MKTSHGKRRGSRQPQRPDQRQLPLVPEGWPAEVCFLADSEWSPAVPPAVRSGICQFDVAASHDATELPRHAKLPAVCHLVRVRRITDPSHPCYPSGGSGLFATADIPPKTLVLEYRGVVYYEAAEGSAQAPGDIEGGLEAGAYETELRRHLESDYVLRFTDDLAVDAGESGNEARYINDFRGISDVPNCRFINFLSAHEMGPPSLRIGTFTVRPVRGGEELTVSYGKSYWRTRGGIRNKWTDAAREEEDYWEREVARNYDGEATDAGVGTGQLLRQTAQAMSRTEARRLTRKYR